MAVFNGVFPILPGKEDDAGAFASETIGDLAAPPEGPPPEVLVDWQR